GGGKGTDWRGSRPAGLIEFIRAGTLRALAVSGATRFFSLPDIPTIAEAAVPSYVVTAWQGLIAPAGLPEPILARLNTEIVRILMQSNVAERPRARGNEPAASSPEQFKTRMAADIAKWTRLADDIHFERI